jgi:uncharacterized membrane protein YkoI
MRYFSIAVFIWLGMMMAGTALGDDDHEQARQLKEAGKILPLQEIIKAAQAEQPGRVIEVDLEIKDGRHVYEVELLDSRGEVWEFYFDATSGELIKRKRED